MDYSNYTLTEVNLTTLELVYNITDDALDFSPTEDFLDRLIFRKSLESALYAAETFINSGDWSRTRTANTESIRDIKGNEIEPYLYSPFNVSKAILKYNTDIIKTKSPEKSYLNWNLQSAWTTRNIQGTRSHDKRSIRPITYGKNQAS